MRAKNLMHGKTSRVQHDGKTVFRGLTSPMTPPPATTRSIVSEDSLPAELEVSAHTVERQPTGRERHQRPAAPQVPLEGVQFHPESVHLPTMGRNRPRISSHF